MEKYLRDVRAFVRWLDGRSVRKERTAAWKGCLVSQGYAPATVNAMLSDLNGLLEFLGLPECRVKFLKVQRRLFRDTHRELTKGEYRHLLEAAHRLGRERLELLVDTIGSTGIRASEVSYITVEAVQQGRNYSQKEDPHHSSTRKALPQAAKVHQKAKNRLRCDLSHQKRKGAWLPTDLGRAERAV